MSNVANAAMTIKLSLKDKVRVKYLVGHLITAANIRKNGYNYVKKSEKVWKYA